MRAAFALRIISGKTIFNRTMPEHLRTLRHCIFTDGIVKKNDSCSAAFYESVALWVCPLSLGGAVAQRLRGFKSAEPEKTVKRSSRRTGVNLQFFPVEPTSLGLKGASSPFFVAPARRNRWHFSGSLLVSKENIPRQQPLPPQSAVQTKKREPSEKTEDSRLFTIFSYSLRPFRQG